MAEPTEETSGQSRQALDGPTASGDTFDDEILAEIEGRLESDDELAPEITAGAGDKVELDKADLPLEIETAEEPETLAAPEIEVDLAGDLDADLDMQEEPEDEAVPGGKKKLIIMAAAALVVVLTAGGLGWWAFAPEEPEEKLEEKLPAYMVKGIIPDLALTMRLNLEPFIIPLLNTKDGRILKITLSLETPDESARTALSEHNRECRDVIYRLLRDRPAKELFSARSKKLLQAQIKTEINHVLKQKLVFKVYFTDFVITG